jgi:hypothetical protein
VELPIRRCDDQRFGRIEEMKRARKALQAMLVCRVLLLIGWSNRAAVGVVLTELGIRHLVEDSRLGELGAQHRQQQGLHHQRINRDDTDQLAPERPSRMCLV